MSEFRIKSSDSDLELILTDIRGGYFRAQIVSKYLNTIRVVWAYTDAYGFADLMENLSSHEKPWPDTKRWESIEGEFKISAACSRLGKVTFEIELSHYGCAEEWALKTQLNTELGQLPRIAKAARAFFGALPT